MAMRDLKKIRQEYNSNQSDRKHEITIKDIALKLGIDKSSVSKLENGKRKPTPEDLLMYHQLFHVSLDYILDDTVTAKQPENARISKQLGITDAVAETMKFIKDVSGEVEDYTSVLNAFIGNKENTFTLINNIFFYLYEEHLFGNKNASDTIMITSIMTYIDHFVRPQLEELFERKQKYDEMIEDTLSQLPPEKRYDEFLATQSMMAGENDV